MKLQTYTAIIMPGAVPSVAAAMGQTSNVRQTPIDSDALLTEYRRRLAARAADDESDENELVAVPWPDTLPREPGETLRMLLGGFAFGWEFCYDSGMCIALIKTDALGAMQVVDVY